MALYADSGVQEYWIVDPEKRTVHVHQNVDGVYRVVVNVDGLASSRAVEGSSINVKDLFDSVWWPD